MCPVSRRKEKNTGITTADRITSVAGAMAMAGTEAMTAMVGAGIRTMTVSGMPAHRRIRYTD